MTKKMSALLISLGLFVMPTVTYAIGDGGTTPAGGEVERIVTAQKLIDLIDGPIDVDIKESEVIKSSSLDSDAMKLNTALYKAVKDYLLEKGQNIETLGGSMDVNSSKCIRNNIRETELKISLAGDSASKKVQLNYINSSSRNADDDAYVLHKVKDLDLDIINSEDIDNKLFNEVDYDKELERVKSKLNDPSISVVVAPLTVNGNGSVWDNKVRAHFYKDDVLYATKDYSYVTVKSITIPDSVGDTLEEYSAYAKPKINEYLKRTRYFEKDAVVSLTKIDSLQEVDESIINKSKNEYLYQANLIDEYKDDLYFVVQLKKEDNNKEETTNKEEAANKGETPSKEETTNKGEVPSKEVTKIVDGLYIPNSNLNGLEVKGTALDKTTDVYKEMVNHLEKKGFKTVYNAYEITLVTGTIDGKLELQFDVGKDNNGKKALVLHKKHDGTLEELNSEVKDGIVSVKVTELSPFIVSLSDKAPNNSQTSSMNVVLYIVIGLSSTLGIAYLLKSKRCENN